MTISSSSKPFKATRKRKSTAIERHIGKQLKKRRQFLKLTQENLAKRVGVTTQQIHKYEKGIDRISASRLYEFSQILAILPHYFYENLEGKKETYIEEEVKTFLQGKRVQILFETIEGRIQSIRIL